MTVTVLAGGVGAAKFLRGLLEVIEPSKIAAVINVGDDFTLHGLAISPDIDTVTYTLADQVNPETGWGRCQESWSVLDELRRLGGEDWFQLGDLDIALHLYRTQRLANGATLTEVTAELAARKGIAVRLLPVTDDPIRTHLRLATPAEGVTELNFQDYFVERRHDVPISAVRFAGADTAAPTPAAVTALRDARSVVIAPSNPFVSIGPVLAVPGIRELLAERRDSVVAVSPIVGGAALKGPAARMMTELGHECSAVGVAGIYRDLAATLVIDEIDAALAPAVQAAGMIPLVTDTIMSDLGRSTATASATMAAVSAIGQKQYR